MRCTIDAATSCGPGVVLVRFGLIDDNEPTTCGLGDVEWFESVRDGTRSGSSLPDAEATDRRRLDRAFWVVPFVPTLGVPAGTGGSDTARWTTEQDGQVDDEVFFRPAGMGVLAATVVAMKSQIAFVLVPVVGSFIGCAGTGATARPSIEEPTVEVTHAPRT